MKKRKESNMKIWKENVVTWQGESGPKCVNYRSKYDIEINMHIKVGIYFDL